MYSYLKVGHPLATHVYKDTCQGSLNDLLAPLPEAAQGQRVSVHLDDQTLVDLCVCTWWADIKPTYVYARGGPTSRRPMYMNAVDRPQNDLCVCAYWASLRAD